MKIDRSNYETWFIDWLDGNLNNIQAEQFNLFLTDNPDLKEELYEIATISIIPHDAEYQGKSGLKRTPADISDQQFDYLCAAYAENDLSPDELAELTHIINNDPNRRDLSELYKNLKLTPSDTRYVNKSKLLRRTPLQKFIRLSLAGVAAAATIALLISLLTSLPDSNNELKETVSELFGNEGRAEHSTVPQEYIFDTEKSEHVEKIIVPSLPIQAGLHDSLNLNKAHLVHLDVKFNAKPLPKSSENIKTSEADIEESLQKSARYNNINPVKIPSNSDIFLFSHTDIQTLSLISSSPANHVLPEERWAAGRFFAKMFRDKILKEETSDDSPIKGYEIAEAGITGLNKLLGWEMTLEKTSDNEGDLKTVYFSSKLLKIETPVNRKESSY